MYADCYNYEFKKQKQKIFGTHNMFVHKAERLRYATKARIPFKMNPDKYEIMLLLKCVQVYI